MRGGAPKVIPVYNQQTGINPYMSNEEKNIQAIKYKEMPPKPSPPPPTLSIEYNQPQNKPQQPKKEYIGDRVIDPSMYMTYVGPNIQNSLYNQYAQLGPYSMAAAQGFIPPVIIKNYTIDGGLSFDMNKNYVYENVLPDRKFSPSYTTLGERMMDYECIRGTILKGSDGHNMDINGMGMNSLDSHVKIDTSNVNPYNSFKRSGVRMNPYNGLPKNFLLYRSAYPIRHNETNGKIDFAKDAMSINIRLYKMVEGSWLINKNNSDKYNNKEKFFKYDEWREIAYYGYIRENIIKKNVCPNFVNMYGYFIDEKSNIEYDKINYIDPNRQNENERQYNISYETNQNLPSYNLPKYVNPNENLIVNGNQQTAQLLQTNIPNISQQIINNIQQSIERNKSEILQQNVTTINNNMIITVNENKYCGKSLVLLTESPTYSIFGWMSQVYYAEGNVYKIKTRGFHRVEEWMNVLFQIMVALYVMQKHEMYIENFDIERNIYIKDLVYRGQTTEYWKYKVNGIDYYIPDCGYLVMIDTDFADVRETNNDVFSEKQTKHKLRGKIFGDTEDTKSKSFEMFIKTFDENNFSKYAQNYGVIKPPTEILSLIGKINSEAINDKEKDIGKYILNYMLCYIHNRIGSYLKKTEIANVRENGLIKYEKGNIIVHKIDNDTYKFVMYLSSNDNMAKIITKEKHDNKDYIISEVSIQSLISYIETESIVQNYKPNEEELTDEKLLETYIIE